MWAATQGETPPGRTSSTLCQNQMFPPISRKTGAGETKMAKHPVSTRLRGTTASTATTRSPTLQGLPLTLRPRYLPPEDYTPRAAKKHNTSPIPVGGGCGRRNVDVT